MILQNAVKITEGNKVTYLPSLHRHDYRSYTFADGDSFAVDGGTDYLRRVGSFVKKGVQIEDWSLNDKDSERTVFERALWGTYGKDGKQPLAFRPIAELEKSHVQAIWLDYKGKIGGPQLVALKKILNIS